MRDSMNFKPRYPLKNKNMALIEELYKQGTINQEKSDALVDMLNKTGKTEEEVILENKIITKAIIKTLYKYQSCVPKMLVSICIPTA